MEIYMLYTLLNTEKRYFWHPIDNKTNLISVCLEGYNSMPVKACLLK